MLLPSSSLPFLEAKSLGYQPLTHPFFLPNERALLDKFQKEMKGCNYVLAGPPSAPEIWRKNMLSLTQKGNNILDAPNLRGLTK